MGNAGRNGGEYYTPRPLIRAIIQVVKPTIGQRIYDGAVGSAGFLCESYEYLKKAPKLSTRDVKTLQEKTFYGKEKKSLAYVIAIMNMILHGIEAPNIIHTNTLIPAFGLKNSRWTSSLARCWSRQLLAFGGQASAANS
jgi:type I restriction enzyme M protein